MNILVFICLLDIILSNRGLGLYLDKYIYSINLNYTKWLSIEQGTYVRRLIYHTNKKIIL